ncbi:MAG: Hachiman antiphage defense system protein HamA [Nitrosotalea sp.]
MLSEWLENKPRAKASAKFDVIDYLEKPSRNDEIIKNDLSKIFFQNTLDYDYLKKLSESIGWERTKKEFIEGTIPKKKNMKRGRFGEMLSSSILEEYHGYAIPIHKLQYTITSGQSLPGTDLIAIKKNDSEITEMCFVESKLRTTSNTKAITEGYLQLEKDKHGGIPAMLKFVMARLADKKDPLLQLFINYLILRTDSRDTFRVVAVYDKKHWSETSLTNLDQEITSIRHKLVIDVVQMEDLQKVVEAFYNSIGYEIDE